MLVEILSSNFLRYSCFPSFIIPKYLFLSWSKCPLFKNWAFLPYYYFCLFHESRRIQFLWVPSFHFWLSSHGFLVNRINNFKFTYHRFMTFDVWALVNWVHNSDLLKILFYPRSWRLNICPLCLNWCFPSC